MRSATRKKTGKDKAYLAWLHELPCSLFPCHMPSRGIIEAAHIGPRGLSQKVPDRQAIPLCRGHHEALHKLGPKDFWIIANLDPRAIIARLNAEYERLNG